MRKPKEISKEENTKPTPLKSKKEKLTDNPLSVVDDINNDLVHILEIVESLNDRMFVLESNQADLVKLSNVTTNTINYILATVYVYESYFIESGIDSSTMTQEIEKTFYSIFNRNNKDTKTIQYSKNVIKKINDQIREFQERVNR